MPAGTYGLAGIATSLLLATNTPWGANPPPSVKVTKDGSFLSEWDDVEDTPPCMFYNGSYQYTAGLCSHFALARMSVGTQITAKDRAISCAASFTTDCILSPEVGLSVPAAFVYDPVNGLKMMIAPKIISMPEGQIPTRHTLSFQHPDGKRTGAQFQFNDIINVEYLEGGTRKISTELLSGEDAFCVQLLRVAFDAQCWDEID